MSGILERAIKEGTPLLDRLDEQICQVTFVWQGEGEIPLLMGDFTGWPAQPVTLEETEPGVWTYTTQLPAAAYVEYTFYLAPDIEERYPDPFNHRRVWNGVNAYNNYFGGPDYTPTPLTRRAAGVARGVVSQHMIESGRFLGSIVRQVTLYQPPTAEPVPLVVVWDGSDYLGRANLNAIVDNLIAQRAIRPIALAMIDNGQSSRFVEYIENEASLYFAIEKVLPYARQHLNLLDETTQPGVHGLLGASMGGLISLFGGLRFPHVFGQVLSQSGAFWIDDPRYEMLIFNLVRQNPVQPLKIWQDAGLLEGLLEGNRRMNALLREKGYNVRYTEYPAGHNYTAWSNYVAEGLKFLFPPQE